MSEDEEEDLPDVGPPLTRKQYILQEVRHLLRFQVWPEEIAHALDYKNADSLNAALVRWKEWDLAEQFERWRYDGNTPPAIVGVQSSKQQAKRKQREEQAA